jgi:hypothetical protein
MAMDTSVIVEEAKQAQQPKSPEGRGPDRRLSRADRRTGLERRTQTAAESGYTGPEQRKGERRGTGLERRRGPGRRRSDDRRVAEEGEMNAFQFEFIKAIETYKKVNHRLYPTWTEILEIVFQLGYRKVLARDIDMEVPEAPIGQLAKPVDEVVEEDPEEDEE